MITLLRRSATQARYVLSACLVLLCGFQVTIIAQAASIESTKSFGRLAEFLPGFLQRGLGSKALLLASFKGTIALGYFHPVVAVLVSGLAAYLTTEPAHEVESGLVDLELARSLPRRQLITRSAILALTTVVAAIACMGFGTWLGLQLFASSDFESLPAATAGWLLIHLGAVGCCFGALGLAIGSGSRRWSTAFTTVLLTIIVLYLVEVVGIGWRPMWILSWVSPYHYYPALSIVAGDAPRWRNIIILMSGAAAMTSIAYWRFNSRDL
jgi:ABC-type transport system involved in multi-copper enzyme maturation permease subunit